MNKGESMLRRKWKRTIKGWLRTVKGWYFNRGIVRQKDAAVVKPDGDGPRPTRAKVILIGVDAATWHILAPLMEKGKLPNFHTLVTRGSSCPLRTLYPALSPVVWNSISTGKLPGKHGIEGFVVEDSKSGKMVPYTSNMRKCKTLWDIMGSYGKHVGVVGWWNSWPAEQVNGQMVCGISGYKRKDLGEVDATNDFVEFTRKGRLQKTSFSDQTYPADFFDRIKDDIRSPSETGDIHPFLGDLWRQRTSMDATEVEMLELLTSVYNADRSYVEIAKHIHTEYHPDFLAFYLAGLDVAGHKYWAFMEPDRFSTPIPDVLKRRYRNVIVDYYAFVDEILGYFLSGKDQNTVIAVVSDHGMSPDDKKYRQTRINSGRHTREDGVLILAGKHIRENFPMKRATVLDLTPTLLALMGLPIGVDMDGGVLEEAFADGFLAEFPITFVHTHDKGRDYSVTPIESPVDDEIKERLRSLGYIE